jgi:hypothetical protein
MLDKQMIYALDRMEQEGMKFHHNNQRDKQWHT